MAPGVSDEAFALAANQMGVATLDQIEAARKLQAAQAQQGVVLSLPDALLQQGVLTPALKENIEKRLRSPTAGAPQQLGNYKLLKKLGEGGMGAVFLAEDTMLTRKVAVKVLPKKFTENSEFLARFRREARAAGKLNHPNIVGAYAVDEELGQHYYVMEYCEGEPLDAHLKRLRYLPEALVLEIAIQICGALQYAHQHSIIHRDIKPANIFLTREGIAKVLDLGLSKNVADTEQSFQTVSGTALGTPHYISPEQAQAAKDIDGRTDIYSLGATLYHLLTGQTPFTASTAAAVMLKQITEQLPDPRDVRPDLSEGIVHIITKAMAKAPEDRYASMAEMLSDLERVKAGEAPNSALLDAAHSSIAMRRLAPSPPRGEGREARERLRGEGAAVRRAGERAPVGRDTDSDRRAGRDRRSEDAATAPGSSKRLYFIVGGAVAGVLLVLGLILTFSGDGKPATTAKGKPEQGKQPTSTPTQAAKAAEPQTPNLKPETVSWPLHDGKEPIPDYAKRVGLPPTETLDLGGGVKMELVLVPAGEFMMGTNDGEPSERPVHKVKISQSYYIGKYDVTVAQFRAFAGATKYLTEAEKKGVAGTVKDGKWQGVPGTNWKNPGYKQEDNYPVVVVTWDDAQEFCKWTTTIAGRTVRLPSEAEWEYAARGPQSSKYPWGNQWDGAKANVADASLRATGFNMQWGESTENDGYTFTSPVGTYKNASWCGAFDMAGNVWRWCQDYFNDIYYAASPATDPPGPEIGRARVMRGGAWDMGSGGCYSAHRHGDRPWLCFSVGGFRAVASSAPAVAIAVRPETANPKPETAPWPLHDGKEPISGYAKRVGLAATETLDLGGGVKMDLVLIPAGRFIMGSPPTEQGREPGETPHEVTITKPFYMAKQEVTYEQFGAITASDRTALKGVLKPVEKVQWDLAQEFCTKMSARTGRAVSLPTEAQWEYACRAGTKGRFHSGDADADLSGIAWWWENGQRTTHPVGQKQPNAWGLYDMHGNVWEWCRDWYGPCDQTGVTDPRGPATGQNRVLRGGSWFNNPHACRAAQRHKPGMDACTDNIGFRVVVEVPGAVQPGTEKGVTDLLKQEPLPDDARWGPWEDLFDGKSLDGWRVPEAGVFAKHGDVRAENGELVLRKGEQGTAATRTGEFPSVDYELTFELKLPTPIVSFPVGTSQWGFFLAKDFTGEGGAGIGPVRVTRSSLSCTARGGFKVPFEEGKWHRIRLRVAAHRITAWVDGQERFEFGTTPHEEQGRGGDDTLKPLAVFTWQGEGAIRAIRLRRLKPEGAQAPVAPKELCLNFGGGVKMDFVLVPAGEFDMGSNDGPGEEKPVHKVKLTKPFYIGKYEVTVAQFAKFIEATKHQTDCEKAGNKGFTVKDGKWQGDVPGINWKQPGFEQTPDHPVVLVSWNDAQAFCKWASSVARSSGSRGDPEGRPTVRLPTEAEWEYAARGPQSAKYPWGEKWEGTKANHGDVSLKNTGFTQWGCTGDNDGFPYTAAVGSYKNGASWCGAFDLAGNVWEWVQDKWSDKYYAQSPDTDPQGPTDGNDHVRRGGGWYDSPNACRSAIRHWRGPDYRDTDTGFRLSVAPGLK